MHNGKRLPYEKVYIDLLMRLFLDFALTSKLLYLFAVFWHRNQQNQTAQQLKSGADTLDAG